MECMSVFEEKLLGTAHGAFLHQPVTRLINLLPVLYHTPAFFKKIGFFRKLSVRELKL